MRHLHFLPGILLSGIILASCGDNATKSDSSLTAEVAATSVKVINLEKRTISRTVNYSANVVAWEELQVAPATPGRVENIFVEVGDKVRKGDKLFQMDRTTLLQQKVQLASLATDLARLDTLLMTGSITQQQYDQMKVQYDVAKSSVEYMEGNTLMVAPFNGTITGRYYENGELYSGAPSAASAGKAAIVTLMQLDQVKVQVSLSEQYLPLVKTGMVAQITTDVYDDQVFEGKVSRVYPTVDATTRTFMVEFQVPNREGLLRPGMFVRLSIDLGVEDVFTLPSNVILMQEGTNTRYIFIEENGVVNRVNVTLGNRYDEMIEVISDGLKEGDRIVSEGQSKLISGDKVNVVE